MSLRPLVLGLLLCLLASMTGRNATHAQTHAALSRSIPAHTSVIAPPRLVQGTGSVLESDDFRDVNAGLFPDRSSTPGVQIGYVGGEYQIARSGVPGNSWIVYTDGTFADVAIDVDARVLGPASGQYAGVFCRIQNSPDSGYRFIVYPGDSTAALAREDGTVYTTLQSTTSPVAAVNPGNALNHLQLICTGNAIRASVNGTPLFAVSDDVDMVGVPGLTAGSDGPSYNARFANYVASRP